MQANTFIINMQDFCLLRESVMCNLHKSILTNLINKTKLIIFVRVKSITLCDSLHSDVKNKSHVTLNFVVLH